MIEGMSMKHGSVYSILYKLECWTSYVWCLSSRSYFITETNTFGFTL